MATLSSNNKAVGDDASQKSVMFKGLLIATKWMPAQGHLQPVIDTAPMAEV